MIRVADKDVVKMIQKVEVVEMQHVAVVTTTKDICTREMIIHSTFLPNKLVK